MKRTTLVTEKKEYVTRLYEKLDMAELSRLVSEKIGIEVKLVKDITQSMFPGREDRYKINIKCEDNLLDYCGIVKFGLREAKLQDFGVHVHKIIEYDNEKLEEARQANIREYVPVMQFANVINMIVYVNLDLRYTLTNGGSNGIHILGAEFNENENTWSIVD